MSESIIEHLIRLFSKMPGLGPKSAERLTFYLLQTNKEYVNELAETLQFMKQKIRHCQLCGNYSEQVLCSLCQDPKRDVSKICIIEEPKDLIAIENLRIYKGRYHILFGVISPINGIGPDDLNIKSLMDRINSEKETLKEIIMATNPTPEGDTTAYYLSKLIQPYKIAITRLAYGMPVGANIDYTDSITLARSFIDRKTLE